MNRLLSSVGRPRNEGASPELVEKLGLLRAADLFRDLDEEQIHRIERMTTMTHCRRGQLVYAPGESNRALFLLKRGRIQVYRLGGDGKKLVLSTLGPGTFFGEMPLTGSRMLGGYAEAAGDCLVCVMSQHDVEALIREYPEVGVRLARELGERVRELEDRLGELLLHDVPSRVAATLLRAADDGIVSLTHQELADLVGTHRETVTRTLGDFRERGLVALRRSRVELLDAERLAAIAHGGATAA